MSEWFSGDVVANNIRMHYHRTGGDRPPLVLSHGASDNGLCWTRLARALEANYDVIMPDARGHGRSDVPAQGYTSADHAADLAGLINALGLRQPALGGHSMGAATTLRLISDQPELAACAFLEDPPLRASQPADTPAAMDRGRDAIRRSVLDAQASDIESTIRRGREASPLWSDEEWQPWAEAKMQVSRAFLDQLMGGSAIPQDWRERLGGVRCPALLLTGDPLLGGIVSPETASEAVQLLPSLQVVHLQGAGHNIRRERFDGFLSAVAEFLGEHVASAHRRPAAQLRTPAPPASPA